MREEVESSTGIEFRRTPLLYTIMSKFQKFMAQHIHKWPIDHSYMRSIVDLRTKLIVAAED